MDFTPYRVTITEGVTQVTLSSFPSNGSELFSFFSDLANLKINVDMISQTAPKGGPICLCITIPDHSLPMLLPLLGRLRRKYPSMVSEVTSGNFKLVFYGDLFPSSPGGAAEIFSFLSDLSLISKLISTSETDISVLTDHLFLKDFIQLSKERFQVMPEILT